MNSIENPELSYLCDLTAEHDKLIQINAELVAALERACAALDMTVNSGDMVAAVTDCDDALLTARAALVKAKQGE